MTVDHLTGQGSEVIQPLSTTVMAGEAAKSLVWESQMGPTGLLRFWTVWTVVDGDALVFACTAPPQTFERHRPSARTASDSIGIDE